MFTLLTNQLMPADNNITITPDATLRINIKAAANQPAAHADIISESGETVLKVVLSQGNNVINISPFIYKNYAIRVVNGANVTVQKI